MGLASLLSRTWTFEAFSTAPTTPRQHPSKASSFGRYQEQAYVVDRRGFYRWSGFPAKAQRLEQPAGNFPDAKVSLMWHKRLYATLISTSAIKVDHSFRRMADLPTIHLRVSISPLPRARKLQLFGSVCKCR